MLRIIIFVSYNSFRKQKNIIFTKINYLGLYFNLILTNCTKFFILLITKTFGRLDFDFRLFSVNNINLEII